MRLLHERVTSQAAGPWVAGHPNPIPSPNPSPEQVPGAMLEDNKYALSVHTRNVSAADLPR